MSAPRLTPHQTRVLRSLGLHVRPDWPEVYAVEVGSLGALRRLVDKGYAYSVIEIGTRGGHLVKYGLTDLGRQTVADLDSIPPVLLRYFDDPEAQPRVSRVFRSGNGGWIGDTRWSGKLVTSHLVTEMRRSGEQEIQVRWAGRVADFGIKELS